MTAPTTTEEPAVDAGKLTTQANELRGAMIEALGVSNDSKVRKLGNELEQVNKQILDLEAKAQVGERQAYMELMHDALNEFEVDGMTLTVKFNADVGVSSVVFTPTDAAYDTITAAVAGITRPSSATKWEYGRDDEGHQSFDFGTGNSTRSMGWAKNGNDITLGDAFDAVATAAEKAANAKLTGKENASKSYALKVKVVTAAGYTKK